MFESTERMEGSFRIHCFLSLRRSSGAYISGCERGCESLSLMLAETGKELPKGSQGTGKVTRQMLNANFSWFPGLSPIAKMRSYTSDNSLTVPAVTSIAYHACHSYLVTVIKLLKLFPRVKHLLQKPISNSFLGLVINFPILFQFEISTQTRAKTDCLEEKRH